MFNIECLRIISFLDRMLARRYNSTIELTKNQLENMMNGNKEITISTVINFIDRHKNYGYQRRNDDWMFVVVREHLEQLQQYC